MICCVLPGISYYFTMIISLNDISLSLIDISLFDIILSFTDISISQSIQPNHVRTVQDKQ